MDWRRTRLLAFFAVLVYAVVCESYSDRFVRLRTGTVQFGVPRPAAQLRILQDNQDIISDRPEPGLAQSFFVSYGTAAKRAPLYKHFKQHSATVHGFIPPNTWLVSALPNVVFEAVNKNLAISVVPYLPEHKIAPEWSAIVNNEGVTNRGGGITQAAIGKGDDSAGTAELIESSSGGIDSGSDFTAVQEGGVTRYVITAQIFSPAGSTVASTRAMVEQLVSSWQQPLIDSVRAASSAASAGSGTASMTGNTDAAACKPALKARGRRLLVVVCAADVSAALVWLSEQREVHWLEPTPRLGRRDIWGNMVVQKGGKDLAASLAQPDRVAAYAFWSQGLDGNGQVLGISDGGVDTDSCYFFDPQVPDVASLLVADPARYGAMLFKSTKHRKLASYYSYSDFGDADGHGTHVAGIAVGSCYGSFNGSGIVGRSTTPPPPAPTSPPPASSVSGITRTRRRPSPPPSSPPSSPKPVPQPTGKLAKDTTDKLAAPPYLIDEATGMAPGAKLAFYDIMDSLKVYRLPSYEEILQYQLNAGVYVQSDSWGSKRAFWYNSLCDQLDDFVWRNPQLLVLTAAGNDGNLQPRPQNGTVSAPANAKNTLSIGSTMSLDPSIIDDGTLMLRIWTGKQDPPDTDPVYVAALPTEESGGASGRTASYSTAGSTVATAGEIGSEAADAEDINSHASSFQSTDEPPPPPPARRRRLLLGDSGGNGDGGADVPTELATPQPPGPEASEAPTAFLASGGALDLVVALPGSTDFRTLRDLEGTVLEAVASTPANACRKLSNGAQMLTNASSGLPKLVVALRGGCMYYVKAMAAATAGAAAIAVVNDAPGDLVLQVNPSGASLPAATLQQQVGQQLLAALATGQRVFVRAVWQPHLPYDDVPSFSAYGPTSDGRIKPDVVAPGMNVLSAWTDTANEGRSDGCAQKMLLSGTSMSAPLAAGSAALARQYFMSGYYPTGRNDSGDAAPFVPSGMLLKAVLIGGAYDMQGTAQLTMERLQPAPSAYQGFGRVDLSSSLPLAAASGGQKSASAPSPASSTTPTCASPRLQLVDYVPIKEGDVHSYKLTAKGTGAIVVTLVWVDPPPDPLSPIALVNNLDLKVTFTPAAAAGAQAVFWGNSEWSGAGRNSSVADTRNNVERISIPAGSTGALALQVYGTAINSRYITRFAMDVQRYALTVHGCFSELLVSEFNPDRRARPPPAPSPSPLPPSPHPLKPHPPRPLPPLPKTARRTPIRKNSAPGQVRCKKSMRPCKTAGT